jgi:CspA family cold shock protein
VDGEIWAHFSAIEASGYRELNEGDSVEFRYRRAHQDA